jgi:hypothetical protein
MRVRGVTDRFLYSQEDGGTTTADECWDMMLARRRAAGSLARRSRSAREETPKQFAKIGTSTPVTKFLKSRHAADLTGVPMVKIFATLRLERSDHSKPRVDPSVRIGSKISKSVLIQTSRRKLDCDRSETVLLSSIHKGSLMTDLWI